MVEAWNCSACKRRSAKSAFCTFCGCPKNADHYLVRGWKESFKVASHEPHLDGQPKHFFVLDPFSRLDRKANCPHCARLMYIYDAQCFHCKHDLSPEERYQLVKLYRTNFNNARNWTLLVFPILILVLTLLFAVSLP